MSFALVDRAINTEGISSGAKLVLIVLAQAANEANNNECWLAVETVGGKAGMSVRSVHRHLKELEGGGLIEIAHQFKKGQQTSSRYTLKLTPCQIVRVGVTNCQGGGDKLADESVIEPVTEPVKGLNTGIPLVETSGPAMNGDWRPWEDYPREHFKLVEWVTDNRVQAVLDYYTDLTSEAVNDAIPEKLAFQIIKQRYEHGLKTWAYEDFATSLERYICRAGERAYNF